MPEILWKADNILNELAALGEAVGTQDTRSEYWPKMAPNQEDL